MELPPVTDFAVVGAGIAGLACAGRLASAGAEVVVLEKSRGLGGRCATRRVEEQPVDHGPAFLHGSAPGFVAALRAADAEPIDGWPHELRGAGSPCHRRALRPGESRLAYRQGLTAFAKHLARGVPVRTGTRVVAVRPAPEGTRVLCADGAETSCRRVVLAAPPPQSLGLLPVAEAPRERAPRHLLGEIAHVRCLTLICLYGTGSPRPDWDVWYPEDSRILQTLIHDSAKRGPRARRALVLQAQPGWSRLRWDGDDWAETMLAEAGRLCGRWAAAPETSEKHRWRHARSAGGELAGPLTVAGEPGRFIACCGEGFAAGGGVQAAWLSGTALANRMLEDER